MRDRPEKKQYGKTAGNRTHQINGSCSICRVTAAKKNNKQAAEHSEKWGTWRVRNSKLIGAGDKLSTIPKTGSRFTCNGISDSCDRQYYPTGNIVYFSEIHTDLILSPRLLSGLRMGKNRVSTEDFTCSFAKTIFKIFERHDLIKGEKRCLSRNLLSYVGLHFLIGYVVG